MRNRRASRCHFTADFCGFLPCSQYVLVPLSGSGATMLNDRLCLYRIGAPKRAGPKSPTGFRAASIEQWLSGINVRSATLANRKLPVGLRPNIRRWCLCPLSAQYRSLVMISSTPESSAGLCPRSRLERTGVLGSARLVRLWDERELSVEFPSFVGVARNPRSMPHVHPRGRRSGLLRVFSQCAHRLGPSANCRNAKNQDFSKTLVPIRFDECSIGFDQRRRAIFYRRRPSAMVHHA